MAMKIEMPVPSMLNFKSGEVSYGEPVRHRMDRRNGSQFLGGATLERLVLFRFGRYNSSGDDEVSLSPSNNGQRGVAH